MTSHQRVVKVQWLAVRLWRALSNQMHKRSRSSDVSRALGNEVCYFTACVIQAKLNPAPFETRISLVTFHIVHNPSHLPALVLGEAELGFDDISAVALELLHALLDDVALGALLGDGDAAPGARSTWFDGLAEADGILVVRGQGDSRIIVRQWCGITYTD